MSYRPCNFWSPEADCDHTKRRSKVPLRETLKLYSYREQLNQKEDDFRGGKRVVNNNQDIKLLKGDLIAEMVNKVFRHEYRRQWRQWETEMTSFATADEGDDGSN